MENKKNGNKFEKELCVKLHDKGFWVHNFMSSSLGQPADIIAIKNNNSYLIDAKVCSNNVFTFNRIELNQISSMHYFEKYGNNGGLFALKSNTNHIYMVPLLYMERLLEKGIKHISLNDIKDNNQFKFEDWNESISKK